MIVCFILMAVGILVGILVGVLNNMWSEEITACGLVGCAIGAVLFLLFADSPLNMEKTNAVYELQTIKPSTYYTTSSSGDKISVQIKKENGFEKISINENLVSFTTTSDAPKVEVTYKKSKFIPEYEDEYTKAVIYLPESENSGINNENTTGSITCSKCGAENKTDAKFCNSCGEELKSEAKSYCSNCGKEISKDAKYCQYCGEKTER